MPSASDGNSDELRAGFQEEALESGVDGIFDHHLVAGAKQHAAEQVERLLAAVGDDEVVVRGGQVFGAGGVEQVAAQRLVSAGGAELQDVGEIGPGHDLFAARAQGVQGEELLGGAGGGEADAVAELGAGRRGLETRAWSGSSSSAQSSGRLG